MWRIIFFLLLMIAGDTVLWAQDAHRILEVIPSNPFYRYIIYENLVIFWLAIIGLLVIIRMKLKEIQRVQKMGLGKGEVETHLAGNEDSKNSL